MTLRASIYKFIFNYRRRFIISRPLRNQNTRKDESPQSPSKFGQYLSSAVAQQQHLKKKNNHKPFILQAPPLVHFRIPLLWGKQSLSTLTQQSDLQQQQTANNRNTFKKMPAHTSFRTQPLQLPPGILTLSLGKGRGRCLRIPESRQRKKKKQLLPIKTFGQSDSKLVSHL